MAKVLIVDDQPMVLKCLKSALTVDGHEIATVSAGDMALKLVGFQSFDIIITDYAMPGMDGLRFLEVAQQRSPGVPIIMVTGYGTADTALEAMRKGAFDYLTKPFSLEALRSTVNAALEYIKARNSIPGLSNPDPSAVPYPNLIAASEAMKTVCKRIDELSRRDCAVLIQGEPGTGKEIIARTLHALGAGRDQTFDRVDCRNLKEGGMLGSILEYGKAATLFLKEVGHLPAGMQKELVGILLTRRFHPSEGAAPTPLRTRILASTSRPLEHLVAEGKFNPDLVRATRDNAITIPPLRERSEDLRVHVGFILRQMSALRGGVQIEPEALIMLERYPWPGNVTELEEILRNAATTAGGSKIGIEHLPREIIRLATLEGGKPLLQLDLKQFRGRVVKSFLQNMKQEYVTMIEKIESFG